MDSTAEERQEAIASSDLPADLDVNDHALLPEPSAPFVLYITGLFSALWSFLLSATLWLCWPSPYFLTFVYLPMIFFSFFLSAWIYLPRFTSNITSFLKIPPDHAGWNYLFIPLLFYVFSFLNSNAFNVVQKPKIKIGIQWSLLYTVGVYHSFSLLSFGFCVSKDTYA